MSAGVMVNDDETIFRNTTQGWVGAVKIGPNGAKESVAVEAGGTVALTPREVELTARAPRKSEDNPFVDHPYEILDPNTGECLESGSRPPLVPDDDDRYIPQAGSRDDREETGTTTAGATRAKRTQRSRRANPAAGGKK